MKTNPFCNISCILCLAVPLSKKLSGMVKPQSYLQFAVCPILLIEITFVCINIRSAVSEAKFGQASNHCEMVFESVKLGHAIIKQGSLSPLTDFVLMTVGISQI